MKMNLQNLDFNSMNWVRKNNQTINRTTFTNLLFEAGLRSIMQAAPWARAKPAGTPSVWQKQSLEFFSHYQIQRKLVSCSHS